MDCITVPFSDRTAPGCGTVLSKTTVPGVQVEAGDAGAAFHRGAHRLWFTDERHFYGDLGALGPSSLDR